VSFSEPSVHISVRLQHGILSGATNVGSSPDGEQSDDESAYTDPIQALEAALEFITATLDDGIFESDTDNGDLSDDDDSDSDSDHRWAGSGHGQGQGYASDNSRYLDLYGKSFSAEVMDLISSTRKSYAAIVSDKRRKARLRREAGWVLRGLTVFLENMRERVFFGLSLSCPAWESGIEEEAVLGYGEASRSGGASSPLPSQAASAFAMAFAALFPSQESSSSLGSDGPGSETPAATVLRPPRQPHEIVAHSILTYVKFGHTVPPSCILRQNVGDRARRRQRIQGLQEFTRLLCVEKKSISGSHVMVLRRLNAALLEAPQSLEDSSHALAAAVDDVCIAKRSAGDLPWEGLGLPKEFCLFDPIGISDVGSHRALIKSLAPEWTTLLSSPGKEFAFFPFSASMNLLSPMSWELLGRDKPQKCLAIAPDSRLCLTETVTGLARHQAVDKAEQQLLSAIAEVVRLIHEGYRNGTVDNASVFAELEVLRFLHDRSLPLSRKLPIARSLLSGILPVTLKPQGVPADAVSDPQPISFSMLRNTGTTAGRHAIAELLWCLRMLPPTRVRLWVESGLLSQENLTHFCKAIATYRCSNGANFLPAAEEADQYQELYIHLTNRLEESSLASQFSAPDERDLCDVLYTIHRMVLQALRRRGALALLMHLMSSAGASGMRHIVESIDRPIGQSGFPYHDENADEILGTIELTEEELRLAMSFRDDSIRAIRSAMAGRLILLRPNEQMVLQGTQEISAWVRELLTESMPLSRSLSLEKRSEGSALSVTEQERIFALLSRITGEIPSSWMRSCIFQSTRILRFLTECLLLPPQPHNLQVMRWAVSVCTALLPRLAPEDHRLLGPSSGEPHGTVISIQEVGSDSARLFRALLCALGRSISSRYDDSPYGLESCLESSLFTLTRSLFFSSSWMEVTWATVASSLADFMSSGGEDLSSELCNVALGTLASIAVTSLTGVLREGARVAIQRSPLLQPKTSADIYSSVTTSLNPRAAFSYGTVVSGRLGYRSARVLVDAVNETFIAAAAQRMEGTLEKDSNGILWQFLGGRIPFFLKDVLRAQSLGVGFEADPLSESAILFGVQDIDCNLIIPIDALPPPPPPPGIAPKLARLLFALSHLTATSVRTGDSTKQTRHDAVKMAIMRRATWKALETVMSHDAAASQLTDSEVAWSVLQEALHPSPLRTFVADVRLEENDATLRQELCASFAATDGGTEIRELASEKGKEAGDEAFIGERGKAQWQRTAGLSIICLPLARPRSPSDDRQRGSENGRSLEDIARESAAAVLTGMGLGFSHDQCVAALIRNRDDLNATAEWLMSTQGRATIQGTAGVVQAGQPSRSSGVSSSTGVSSGGEATSVASLGGIGFSLVAGANDQVMAGSSSSRDANRRTQAAELAAISGMPEPLCYHALQISNDDPNAAFSFLIDHGDLYALTMVPGTPSMPIGLLAGDGPDGQNVGDASALEGISRAPNPILVDPAQAARTPWLLGEREGATPALDSHRSATGGFDVSEQSLFSVEALQLHRHAMGSSETVLSSLPVHKSDETPTAYVDSLRQELFRHTRLPTVCVTSFSGPIDRVNSSPLLLRPDSVVVVEDILIINPSGLDVPETSASPTPFAQSPTVGGAQVVLSVRTRSYTGIPRLFFVDPRYVRMRKTVLGQDDGPEGLLRAFQDNTKALCGRSARKIMCLFLAHVNSGRIRILLGDWYPQMSDVISLTRLCTVSTGAFGGTADQEEISPSVHDICVLKHAQQQKLGSARSRGDVVLHFPVISDTPEESIHLNPQQRHTRGRLSRTSSIATVTATPVLTSRESTASHESLRGEHFSLLSHTWFSPVPSLAPFHMPQADPLSLPPSAASSIAEAPIRTVTLEPRSRLQSRRASTVIGTENTSIVQGGITMDEDMLLILRKAIARLILQHATAGDSASTAYAGLRPRRSAGMQDMDDKELAQSKKKKAFALKRKGLMTPLLRAYAERAVGDEMPPFSLQHELGIGSEDSAALRTTISLSARQKDDSGAVLLEECIANFFLPQVRSSTMSDEHRLGASKSASSSVSIADFSRSVSPLISVVREDLPQGSVVLESLHPLFHHCDYSGEIVLRDAKAIRILFDERSEMASEGASLHFYSDSTQTHLLGSYPATKTPVSGSLMSGSSAFPPLIVQSNKIFYRVTMTKREGQETGWGFLALISRMDGLQWLDERQAVSQPSLEWACWLLEFMLNEAGALSEETFRAVHHREIFNALAKYLRTQGMPFKDRIVALITQMLLRPDAFSEDNPPDLMQLNGIARAAVRRAQQEQDVGRSFPPPLLVGLIDMAGALALAQRDMQARKSIQEGEFIQRKTTEPSPSKASSIILPKFGGPRLFRLVPRRDDVLRSPFPTPALELQPPSVAEIANLEDHQDGFMQSLVDVSDFARCLRSAPELKDLHRVFSDSPGISDYVFRPQNLLAHAAILNCSFSQIAGLRLPDRLLCRTWLDYMLNCAVIESAHPYCCGEIRRGCITIPNAESLAIIIDSQHTELSGQCSLKFWTPGVGGEPAEELSVGGTVDGVPHQRRDLKRWKALGRESTVVRGNSVLFEFRAPTEYRSWRPNDKEMARLLTDVNTGALGPNEMRCFPGTSVNPERLFGFSAVVCVTGWITRPTSLAAQELELKVLQRMQAFQNSEQREEDEQTEGKNESEGVPENRSVDAELTRESSETERSSSAGSNIGSSIRGAVRALLGIPTAPATGGSSERADDRVDSGLHAVNAAFASRTLSLTEVAVFHSLCPAELDAAIIACVNHCCSTWSTGDEERTDSQLSPPGWSHRRPPKMAIDFNASDFYFAVKQPGPFHQRLTHIPFDVLYVRFCLLQRFNKTINRVIESLDVAGAAAVGRVVPSYFTSSALLSSDSGCQGESQHTSSNGVDVDLDVPRLDPLPISAQLRGLRHLIFFERKQKILDAAIVTTGTSSRSIGRPTIDIDNAKAMHSAEVQNKDPFTSQCVMMQMYRQLTKAVGATGISTLFRGAVDDRGRLFSVKYAGEAGIDYGGVSRDAISRATDDLFSDALDLFVPCRNARLQAVDLGTDGEPALMAIAGNSSASISVPPPGVDVHPDVPISAAGSSATSHAGSFSDTDVGQTAVASLVAFSMAEKKRGGECYLPNPRYSTAPRVMAIYQFIGKFLGMSIRAKMLLPMQFCTIVWKRLVGVSLDLDDLREIDSATVTLLEEIINWEPRLPSAENLGTSSSPPLTPTPLVAETSSQAFAVTQRPQISDPSHDFASAFPMLTFSTIDANGEIAELCEGGDGIPVTYENRHTWAAAVLQYHMTICDAPIRAMRQGLYSVVPQRALRLLTPSELELAVSGHPEISVAVLKANTDYEGYRPQDATIQYFWKVLGDFSDEEKALYLRFIWGRSRLPSSRKLPKRMKILRRSGGDNDLPLAHTCFLSVELPPYTSMERMRWGLLTAIHYGSGGILNA
jgi:hypothetical protein